MFVPSKNDQSLRKLMLIHLTSFFCNLYIFILTLVQLHQVFIVHTGNSDVTMVMNVLDDTDCVMVGGIALMVVMNGTAVCIVYTL